MQTGDDPCSAYGRDTQEKMLPSSGFLTRVEVAASSGWINSRAHRCNNA
jgi:hypothetical protein